MEQNNELVESGNRIGSRVLVAICKCLINKKFQQTFQYREPINHKVCNKKLQIKIQKFVVFSF